MRGNMSYTFFLLPDAGGSIFWEKKLIATLAQNRNIMTPSENWLGNSCTKIKVQESGLWQVQNLNGPVMTTNEWANLQEIIIR